MQAAIYDEFERSTEADVDRLDTVLEVFYSMTPTYGDTHPDCYRPSLASVTLIFLAILCTSGCSSSEPVAPTPEKVSVPIADVDEKLIASPSSFVPVDNIRFDDVTQGSRVNFQWSGGPTSSHCMTEQNGGGVALFDFDRDQFLDILLTDCGVFDGSGPSAVNCVHLYRGRGQCQFDLSSRNAGLSDASSAMGVAAGDINSDGFTDMLVACYGRNLLYINSGDGTFLNVTEESIPFSQLWSTSPAFADLNGDGLLDLYIVNYVDWTPEAPLCRGGENQELILICSPVGFAAQPDELLINRGDGHFDNLSSDLGISSTVNAKGLAICVADFTEDGSLDIFVANDTTPNSLYANRSFQGFDDKAIPSGVAVSSDGTHGASMGAACGDYNRDGHFDLLVSNFRNQSNDLFEGLGSSGFIPSSSRTTIDMSSRDKLAFGLVFNDFDLDGWQDIFIANGHIWDLSSDNRDIDYEMSADLIQNINGQSFRNVSKFSGEYFSQKWLGRAVAAGDIDNDGAADLVVQHVGKPARLLRNSSHLKSNSILLDIVGTIHCREPLGCRVTVSVAGESSVMHIPSGGSFQANHDRRLIIRVPTGQKLDCVTICWPDGTNYSWQDISVDDINLVVLVEGATRPYGFSTAQ
jgi:enediyne biosynthesis protein E4